MQVQFAKLANFLFFFEKPLDKPAPAVYNGERKRQRRLGGKFSESLFSFQNSEKGKDVFSARERRLIFSKKVNGKWKALQKHAEGWNLTKAL